MIRPCALAAPHQLLVLPQTEEVEPPYLRCFYVTMCMLGAGRVWRRGSIIWATYVKNTGAKIMSIGDRVELALGWCWLEDPHTPPFHSVIAGLKSHVVISPLQREGWNHPCRAPRFLTENTYLNPGWPPRPACFRSPLFFMLHTEGGNFCPTGVLLLLWGWASVWAWVQTSDVGQDD